MERRIIRLLAPKPCWRFSHTHTHARESNFLATQNKRSTAVITIWAARRKIPWPRVRPGVRGVSRPRGSQRRAAIIQILILTRPRCCFLSFSMVCALCVQVGGAAESREQPESTKKSPGGGRMVASLSSTPTPRLTSQTKPTDGRTRDENSLLARSLSGTAASLTLTKFVLAAKNAPFSSLAPRAVHTQVGAAPAGKANIFRPAPHSSLAQKQKTY